jgi:hypothetical protein
MKTAIKVNINIKHLNTKLVLIIFKHSVRISKKTTHYHYKNQLMPFTTKIVISSEIRTKPTNIFRGQNVELLIVKVGGTYSYHYALKD